MDASKAQEEKQDFVQLDVADDEDDENSDGEITSPAQISQTTDVPISILDTAPPVLPDNPRKLGACIAFYYVRQNPIFTIGPHWPLFIGMNSFVIGLSSLFLFFVISKVTYIGTVTGVILLISQTFLNPGIPDRNLSKPGAAQKVDKK